MRSAVLAERVTLCVDASSRLLSICVFSAVPVRNTQPNENRYPILFLLDAPGDRISRASESGSRHAGIFSEALLAPWGLRCGDEESQSEGFLAD